MAHAAPSTLKDDTTPPREGWERPPELMGYVTVEDFKHLGPERTNKRISWKCIIRLFWVFCCQSCWEAAYPNL